MSGGNLAKFHLGALDRVRDRALVRHAWFWIAQIPCPPCIGVEPACGPATGFPTGGEHGRPVMPRLKFEDDLYGPGAGQLGLFLCGHTDTAFAQIR